MKRTLIAVCVLLFIIYLLERYNANTSWAQMEGFDNNVNEDPYTEKYVNYYNKVFNSKPYYKKTAELVLGSINRTRDKNTYILDAGTGCGRVYKHITEITGKTKPLKMIGIDKSENMLRKAKVNNPEGIFEKGDLCDMKLFKGKTFSHIMCLQDTLYHNMKEGELNEMLANFYYWLKPGGHLYLHVFDGDKLDPAPREYSRKITDKNGRDKSITFFKDYTHEGYWKSASSDDDVKVYVERFVLPSKKIDKQNHTLYFIKKSDLLTRLKDNFFKLIDVVSMKSIDVDDHELYIFKKQSEEKF